MTLEDFLSIQLMDGAQIEVRQVGGLSPIGYYNEDDRAKRVYEWFNDYLGCEVVNMYITNGWADIEIEI